jgi:hypothetical protein
LDRRTIRELVAKYRLEPSIRDIFVEGPADRAIVSWALRACRCADAKVFEIATVEVPAALLRANDLTSGERQRVQALARELERLLGPTAPQPTCVIDADCDRLLGIPLGEAPLFATDYPSMEVYLFHEEDLGRFMNLVLGRGVDDISRVMRGYAAVLQELFLIRAANYALGLGLNWLDFTKCCTTNGEIHFDRDEFINRILDQQALRHRKEELLEAVGFLRRRAAPEIRHQIHGHDFIALLNFENSRRARRAGLPNEQAVRSALIACLGTDRVLQEGLFRVLQRRAGR